MPHLPTSSLRYHRQSSSLGDLLLEEEEEAEEDFGEVGGRAVVSKVRDRPKSSTVLVVCQLFIGLLVLRNCQEINDLFSRGLRWKCFLRNLQYRMEALHGVLSVSFRRELFCNLSLT